MEAVKWDLNRATKVTIYSGKNEITYDLFDGKWYGGGVIVGSKSMKLLIEKYEKAGCVVIPEAGAYIPTDTMYVRIGKWKPSAYTEKWWFSSSDQYDKVGSTGWKDKEQGRVITTYKLLAFINEAVEHNEVIRFYNKNMEVIGHYE